MTARRRTLLILALGLLTLAVIEVFQHVGGTRLVTDTQGTASGPSMAPVVHGGDRFYVAYAGSLCVKHGELATITSIEPRDAHGGLEVTAFSVFQRPSSHAIRGAAPGQLGDMPDFQGGETVGSTCGGKQPLQEIAIEFYKPDAKDAWASDFTVHYVADRRARTTNIRLGVALCEKEGCGP